MHGIIVVCHISEGQCLSLKVDKLSLVLCVVRVLGPGCTINANQKAHM